MTAERVIPNFEPEIPPVEFDAPRNGNGTTRPRVNNAARPLPHDLLAERSLLGALLLSKDGAAFDAHPAVTRAGVEPEDFYAPAHRAIYETVATLRGQDAAVDVVTVAANCGHAPPAGYGDTLGAYLVELTQDTPAISSAATYASIVRGLAYRRRVISLAADIADWGYDTNIEDPLTLAAPKLDDLATRHHTTAVSMFADMSATPDQLPPPSLCPRQDEKCCFLYPGRLHTLIGPSEAGKSWLADLWCVQLMAQDEHVVVLDWEDTATGHKARLLAMGATLEQVNTLFHYAQRDRQWTDAARRELAASLEQWKPALVVVDAMTPALATEGADDWRGVDVARFYSDVVRVCRNAGAAVLVIDHVNKADETQTGSHYKKGGIDGVSYKLRKATPMGRGRRGLSTLLIEKDRHGFLRGHAVGDADVIGTLVVDDLGDEMDVHVAAPAGAIGTADADGGARYPALMEKESRVIEAATDGVTRTGIYEAVGGNRMKATRALAALLKEGWCSEQSGPSRIVSVTPFRCEPVEPADVGDF